MGKGPKSGWPEVLGKGFLEKVNIYYEYLNKKTYYRDIKQICHILNSCGLQTNYSVLPMSTKKYIPQYLKRNGFPRGAITLFTVKEAPRDGTSAKKHVQPMLDKFQHT